jgi:hypothetical protein
MMHLYNNINHDFLTRDAYNQQIGTELTGTNWEYRPCVSTPYYIGKLK